MAGWKELVMGNMGEDIQARRGAKIDLKGVLANLNAYEKEKRGYAAREKDIQQQAYYGSYPEAAGKALGAETDTSGVGADGMRKTKVTRGGATWEAEEPLDAQFFAKEYTKWAASIDDKNVTLGLMNKPQIKKQGFSAWMQETFPEYSDEVLKTMKAGKAKSKIVDLGELTAKGKQYAADSASLVDYYVKANPDKTEEEIVSQMKKAGLLN